MGLKKFEHIFTKELLQQLYVEQGLSAMEIGRRYGVVPLTIRNYMDFHGLTLRENWHYRKYKDIDAAGFENLDTDWHAYWVGFIAADGCVHTHNNSPTLVMRLKSTDAPLLHNLKEGLKADQQISIRTYGKYSSCDLTIRSPELVSHLAKWGVTPRKSMTILWPYHLPPERMAAFIRGYFDGNGSIFKRNRAWSEYVCRFISGSPLFLEGLKQELEKHGIRTIKQYRNQGTNAYVLPISTKRENLLLFYSFIYSGSTVCLERKRALLQEAS